MPPTSGSFTLPVGETARIEFQVDIFQERGMWELHIDVEVAAGADSEKTRTVLPTAKEIGEWI